MMCECLKHRRWDSSAAYKYSTPTLQTQKSSLSSCWNSTRDEKYFETLQQVTEFYAPKWNHPL